MDRKTHAKRTKVVARLLHGPTAYRSWGLHARIGTQLPDGSVCSSQFGAPYAGAYLPGEEMPSFRLRDIAAELSRIIKEKGLNRFCRPPEALRASNAVYVYFAKGPSGIWVRGVWGYDDLGAIRYRYDIIGGRA